MSAAQIVGMVVAGTLLFLAGLAIGGLGRRGGRVAEGAATPPELPVAPEPEPSDPLGDRLRHALDAIEQGVILFGPGGEELLRNRTATSYAASRDPVVLVEAAVSDLVPAALAGRVVRREVEIFGPPAQSFVVVASPSGDPEGGALVIVHDRSLQRRTETVRRDFVANISHELKTPIGALGLLAETIRDEAEGEEGEVIRRLAERMITEAERAGTTVDDLLELSRIEFADEAEFEPVRVRSVVGEAVSRISTAADHAGISVGVEVPADLRVVGDRRQLVSALYNLVDNAVKYSPEGSSVVVSARVDADSVLLQVADEGIGIPRRDLDRVFERFYRVDRARSRRTGGTGLGLAIVRHVASNHQGEVTVESTEGVGSVFTLRLPGA